MKILRYLCLGVAKFLFIFSVLFFMLSLCASFVLENGISNLLTSALPNFGESIQHKEIYINEEEIQELDINEVYNQFLDDLGITEEQLINIIESPVTKELINEFVDTVLEDAVSGDTSDFNLGDKVLTFIEDNQSEIESVIGEPLPMHKIEDFANSEKVNNFNEQYKNIMSTVSGSIPEPVKKLISYVEMFISKEFRIKCLIISGFLLVIIALLQWTLYKWIRTFGNTMLGVGIFTFIFSFLGNIFSSAIVAFAGFGGTVAFTNAMWSSAICVCLGIVLLIIYSVIKKCVKKEKKNEISQNAC